MSITNKNRIQGLILMLVGVSLLIAYKIQGDALVHEELVFGFGIGCLSGGVAAFLGTFLFKKGKYNENYKIQEKDERLHQIWDKAGYSAYNLSYLVVLFMCILVSIFEMSAISILIALLVIMPVAHIGFTYYYNKKI